MYKEQNHKKKLHRIKKGTSALKKQTPGTREVAKWIKCFPSKDEDLSADPQHPCKKPNVVVIPVLGVKTGRFQVPKG